VAKGAARRGRAGLDLAALPPPPSPAASGEVDLDALPPPVLPRRPARVRPGRRAPVARIVARDHRRRRQARALGAGGFVVAAALPARLLHPAVPPTGPQFPPVSRDLPGLEAL